MVVWGRVGWGNGRRKTVVSSLRSHLCPPAQAAGQARQAPRRVLRGATDAGTHLAIETPSTRTHTSPPPWPPMGSTRRAAGGGQVLGTTRGSGGSRPEPRWSVRRARRAGSSLGCAEGGWSARGPGTRAGGYWGDAQLLQVGCREMALWAGWLLVCAAGGARTSSLPVRRATEPLYNYVCTSVALPAALLA
jgi:hypothetical protein